MPRQPVKAIIFDMDGVITLTMPYHCRAWQKVFSGAGIHVSKLEIYAREGQRGIHSVLEIFHAHGMTITSTKAKILLREKEDLFKTIEKTPFVPGSRSFIKKYHQKGLKIALVTGTARHEIHKILPKTLLDCFQVIVSGSDVRQGKPHPEPYRKALKALNIGREEAIVIENAPFGITSAKRAGIRCLAIETSLPKRYLKDADHIVKDFSELETYIQRHYTL